MATEKRLIDAWKLVIDLAKIKKYRDYDHEDVMAVIASQETVYAVEVVRCKDCKHHEIFDDLLYCDHTRGLAGSVSQDGYCYLGEREDNGSE